MASFDFNGDGHTSYVEAAYALGMTEDADRNGEWPENNQASEGATVSTSGCLAGIALAAIAILAVVIASMVGAL